MRRKLRDLYWLFIPWAAFLGGLGGWTFRPFRWLGISLSGLALAAAYGLPEKRVYWYFPTTLWFLTLGYSPQKNSWLEIALIGASYGMTPLLLRFKWRWLWFPLFTSAVVVGLMKLSLVIGFPWKLWEIVVFGLHGFLVSYVIHDNLKENAL